MLDVTTHDDGRDDGEERELTAERGPVRTCVGCRTKDDKSALVRLAIVPTSLRENGAAVLVDVAGKIPGRGLSVHPTRACITQAVERGGIAKVVRGAPGVTAAGLVAMVRARLVERAEGILGGARRARRLAVGTDAVASSIERALALLVATDAAGKSAELEARAQARTIPVVRFFDKLSLGALVRGRGDGNPMDPAAEPVVGVVAILDEGVATEVVRALGRASQLSEAR